MSELGQLLRKARMEQGISLEQLQEITKIRKRYLECIEEGDYNALPGSFYVRAFIKSYAEAVGLDPAEVLSLYRNVLPQINNEVVEGIAPKRTVSKRSDKWSRFATGVMLATFFLLIVGLIYYFAYRNYNGSTSVNEASPAPLTVKTSTDAPASGTPSASAVTDAKSITPSPSPQLTPELKFLRSDKAVDYYELTNATVLQVEMTLKGTDCWFQIDKLTPNGDQFTRDMIEQGTLAKLGSPRKWESDKPVYLNIGLPKAVDLKVNGALMPLGDLSNPKRVQIQLAAAQ